MSRVIGRLFCFVFTVSWIKLGTMQLYQRLLFPLLTRLDAERAHDRTLAALQLAQETRLGRLMLQRLAGKVPTRPLTLFGLSFPHILGLAAGFDKDARVARGLGLLGFGHIEVGTLTPRPQPGNPKPRIFRLREDQALINRMGFPNSGVVQAVARLHRLASLKERPIIGVSLGKQKETPLTEAALDYLQVMRAVYRYADYLAVNISSPNTPGLRELQGSDYLDQLLHTLRVENEVLARRYNVGQRPLLVKIAPDLTHNELDTLLESITRQQIAGIIATNTTLSREGLHSTAQKESGGLSGQPLAQRSTDLIQHIARQTNGRLPIIGVGGVQTAADAQAKLDAGASLIQLYTGLVYEGPSLPGRLLRELYQDSKVAP